MSSNRARYVRAFFTYATLVLRPMTAWASPERLDGFELRSCSASGHCVHVQTSEARRSPLDSAYAFNGPTQVETFAKKGDGAMTLIQKFIATSGTYDPETRFVILRGKSEAFIDLEVGELNVLGREGLFLAHED